LYCTCISDYRREFGFDDWICCVLYIHTTRNYRQYSAVAIVHSLQFTVTHALGFSVFTSRILATVSSQSHCEVLLSRPNSFLDISSQSPSTAISRTRPNSLPTSILYSFLALHFSPSSDCVLLQLIGTDPTVNTVFYRHECMFAYPLPSNRRLIVPRVCFCGNVFSESLSSNRYTRHSIIIIN
jgi:hypothetical protein